MAGLSLTDIEAKWRASGSGVCVIVEGETEQDDPWYYNKWFSHLAREVTFFHQDGWAQVVNAVMQLRQLLGEKKVYGILDRDVETPVYTPFTSKGLVRTHKYTLENYLLDPDIWFEVIAPTTLRSPKPGWESRKAAHTTITSLYHSCIPIAAYNWTLHFARLANPAAYHALPDTLSTWGRHPDNFTKWGAVDTRLDDIQTYLGLMDNLHALFDERKAYLATLPLCELEQYVSGKPVLTLLQTSLQRSKAWWDDMLSDYMYHAATPPEDLLKLVKLILTDAHTVNSSRQD